MKKPYCSFCGHLVQHIHTKDQKPYCNEHCADRHKAFITKHTTYEKEIPTKLGDTET